MQLFCYSYIIKIDILGLEIIIYYFKNVPILDMYAYPEISSVWDV